ncbi:MAG: DUF4199 domain-containing protein [Prevotella sp.]|nr:DUF4199 domain-containing protein [Prevotella sp.]
MTPQEYVQLKAFARQDGAMLALLWIGGFVCYIHGLTNPLLGLLAMILVCSSPFFAAGRLRHFRDYAREGDISFARSYAYIILIFFYAGILLAIAIYLYFAFLDNGFFLGKIMETLQTEEGKKMIAVYGLQGQMDESFKELSSYRPIDYSLNMLTINIITGFVLGLPIAAIIQRQRIEGLKN